MKNALLKMHLAVFLWGFTGVLGRAIHLPAFTLVWYRTFITAIILCLILLFKKELIKISFKEWLRFAAIGSVIAIHWVAFYASIKYANASIALTCLATAGIFTAILEPILLKSKFNYKELVVGFIALIGMYFIYHFEINYATGIMLGILASVLSSVFTILNKKIVSGYPAMSVAFYEIGAGFLFLTGIIFIDNFLPNFIPNYRSFFSWSETLLMPTNIDFLWLGVLSLVCTVIGQSLALSALKFLSSFTTVLLVNLEPVYGIILAILIYQENKDLGVGFILGIALIASSVGFHTYNMMKIRKKGEVLS